MRIYIVFYLIFALTGCVDQLSHHARKAMQVHAAQSGTSVTLDSFTARKIDRILALRHASPHAPPGQVIDLISRQFLGTPYVANGLIGSATIPEQLVIDFRAMDCFTYLDYVEALRHAQSRTDFVQRLIRTRYVGGEISFLDRKHFFSDWADRAPALVLDVTAKISPHAVHVVKNLNDKTDGKPYVPGLPDVEREITYIPGRYIDGELLKRLHVGDYVGIYTNRAGLDVSHVGIYVVTRKGPMLRNASSLKANRKIVDSPFLAYVKSKPGIVVYRPR